MKTISRRNFFSTAGSLTFSLLHFPAISKNLNMSSPKTDKPNILLIMTDQQFAGVMSNTGHAYVNTPNMDSIAANGMRFDLAYCAQPVCIPSRNAMFSGKYPHENGVYYNSPNLNANVSHWLGKLVKDAGYDTGYVGKWHLNVSKSSISTNGFDYQSNMKDNKVDFDIPGGCKTFLETQRTNPFFLVASFVNPHDICQWARGDNLKNGSIPSVPAPADCPPLPDNFGIPNDEPEMIRTLQTWDSSTYPTLNWLDDKWRQYRWAYDRMTELVDGHIGEVLTTLKAQGLEDNTVIIFLSDHGDGYAAHKWNQKQVLYDEAARVPLIISWKGKTVAGGVDNSHLVHLGLDLMPTICEYTGATYPDGLMGMSLKSLAEGQSVTNWRDKIFVETEFGPWNQTTGIKGRCIRTNQYKYIVYNRGVLREELFDMTADPGEMNNLATNAAYESVLLDFREDLKTWITDTNDNFKIDDIPDVTDVQDRVQPPHSFTLEQNYPNPFNSSTTIRYSIQKNSNVKLTIFDIQGRKIKTLVNEHQAIGNYIVRWDGDHASGLPVTSGTYICRLEADQRIVTRTMQLLK